MSARAGAICEEAGALYILLAEEHARAKGGGRQRSRPISGASVIQVINHPRGSGAQHEARFPAAPDKKTLGGGVLAGLVTALCCGGLPLSIGLGAAYSSLGLWRYVPVFLALGTLSIVAINWLSYRRKARVAASPAQLRRAMFVSAAIGLVCMVGALFFLEWLEHAVGPAERFAEGAHPEAPGAMNQARLYALGVLPAGLVLLGVLPFKISQRR